MSLFFRVFTFLFLFVLSGSIFAAGSAGGDTVTKWYQSSRAGVMICDTDLSKACIARYGGSPNEISVSCNETYYSNTYSNPAGGETVVGGYHDIGTNSKTCTAPQVFNLNKTTCSGSCVTPPPEPCADKKGQIKSFSVQCGTFNCPAGSKTVLDGSIVCDKAPGYFTPSTPPSSANFNGCALQAQAVPEFTMGDAIGLNSEVGGQTQAGFCAVEYKYTGGSGNGADTPTSTNGTGFNVSYLPAGAGGQCPAGYKPGVLNGNNICAPDSASTGQCPTGQIRNNSGVCVNNADAATDPNATTTNNPDGSVTKTSSTTKVNADGTVTKTTTKETTNPDGSKSKVSKSVTNNTNNTTTTQTTTTNTSKNGVTQTNVTTTNSPTTNNTTNNTTTNHTTNNTSTVNPDGSITDTPSHGADSSSTQNPDGTSSGSGGGGSCTSGGCSAETSSDCLTPPVCSGDVILCGLLNQQWLSTCKQTESLTGLKEGEATKYDQVGTNSNDARVSAATGSFTQKVNDIKGFLVPPSTGSCPADITITVMSKAIVLPIFKLCPLFQLMRFLLHLIVNLMCLRILYSSFIRV